MFRSLLFLIVVLRALPVLLAQAPVHTFHRAVEPLDRVALKVIIEELRSDDPQATAFLNDDGTILQVKSSAAFGAEAQQAAIARAGIALQPGTVDPASLITAAPGGAPVYVVTGDAAADRQRYEQAVQQWNAAHPDQPIGTAVHLIEQ